MDIQQPLDGLHALGDSLSVVESVDAEEDLLGPGEIVQKAGDGSRGLAGGHFSKGLGVGADGGRSGFSEPGLGSTSCRQ